MMSLDNRIEALNSIGGIINEKNSILTGAADAFIDYQNNSNLAYRPEFVINNYRQGQKVLSVIDRELLDCNEFCMGNR